jgi:hypothetical protein
VLAREFKREPTIRAVRDRFLERLADAKLI